MVEKNVLIDKMKTFHMSQECMARFLHISSNSLRNKMYGRTDFLLKEMLEICDLLHLTDEERDHIFFQKQDT